MRLMTFYKWILSFSVPLYVHAQKLAIPDDFQNGKPIEQVIVLCDVDGVIRDSVDDVADPRVIEAFRSLLKHDSIHVAFISGTPIETDQSLEPWRRGNVSLNSVFNRSFDIELASNKVCIFGVLGGERMLPDCGVYIEDEYSFDHTFELSRLLLGAFLKEVIRSGDSKQQTCAQQLQNDLDRLEWNHDHQKSHTTPIEFNEIVTRMRLELDPHFRLINSGALIEIHASNPPWNASLSFSWLAQEVQKNPLLNVQLADSQRKLATGYAKKGSQGFNFLLVSKTNKGKTAFRYIQEKLQEFPNALVITIGDTQIDFPMHRHAHLAFHVGAEQVWKDEKVSQCILIRGENGEDHQHVEGTLRILYMLEEAIGKSCAVEKNKD